MLLVQCSGQEAAWLNAIFWQERAEQKPGKGIQEKLENIVKPEKEKNNE